MIALLLIALQAVTGSVADVTRAARAYRAGHYARAARWYGAALTRGDHDEGALLFNLGNCAFRLGHHAEAILHYRRALLRLPLDPEVGFNLRLAERELGIHRASDAPLYATTLAWLDALPPRRLLLLASLLQTVGLFGLLLARRRGARLGSGLLVLLGLLAAGRLVWNRWFPGPPAGIVLDRVIAVRPEPHARDPVLFEIRAGQSVRVEEASDRWMRIAHPHGRGWTERPGVGVVETP